MKDVDKKEKEKEKKLKQKFKRLNELGEDRVEKKVKIERIGI